MSDHPDDSNHITVRVDCGVWGKDSKGNNVRLTMSEAAQRLGMVAPDLAERAAAHDMVKAVLPASYADVRPSGDPLRGRIDRRDIDVVDAPHGGRFVAGTMQEYLRWREGRKPQCGYTATEVREQQRRADDARPPGAPTDFETIAQDWLATERRLREHITRLDEALRKSQLQTMCAQREADGYRMQVEQARGLRTPPLSFGWHHLPDVTTPLPPSPPPIPLRALAPPSGHPMPWLVE